MTWTKPLHALKSLMSTTAPTVLPGPHTLPSRALAAVRDEAAAAVCDAEGATILMVFGGWPGFPAGSVALICVGAGSMMPPYGSDWLNSPRGSEGRALLKLRAPSVARVILVAKLSDVTRPVEGQHTAQGCATQHQGSLHC